MIRTSLAFLLLLNFPALAQARSFTIAGEAFAEADIVDARALPGLTGEAAVMVTFADGAAQRLVGITRQFTGKPIAIVLDGKILSEPRVLEPIEGGVVQITGGLTMENAIALAKQISGKEPLPESLED